jgi:hypothetical protein
MEPENSSVKYLISPNYYIQKKKKRYYIHVYTTIKDYLAVAWWFLPVNYNYSRSRNMIVPKSAMRFEWKENIFYIDYASATAVF